MLFIVALNTLVIAANCQREKYPVNISRLTYKNKKFNIDIKTNGYYAPENLNSPVIYFFNDGTIYHFGISASNDSIDNSLCPIFPDKAREVPWHLGVFLITNDTIKIQTFNPYRGSGRFDVEEKWAKIVNNTTIHFFKFISTNEKQSVLDETFYFHQCTNKPDSTNVLMKY